MENSKIILLIVIILLFSCKQKHNRNLKDCVKCIELKDSLLFIDKNSGDIYVKIKSVDLHPSLTEKLKANNYYSYYNCVYLFSLDKNVHLNEFIDIKTFKKIDKNGNYFEDKNFVYFSPYMPIGDFFNLIDKKENVKFSLNKDTLYSKFGTFYRGVLIDSKKLFNNE